MIMLLSFFACLTSMFTLVSDSVEMSHLRLATSQQMIHHSQSDTLLVSDQCIPRSSSGVTQDWQVDTAVVEDRQRN